MWRRYRCQFDTRNKSTKDPRKRAISKRTKNTECKTTLTFKLLKERPACLVSIDYQHNHPTHSLQALTFRDVSATTAETIRGLFDQGYVAGNFFIYFFLTPGLSEGVHGNRPCPSVSPSLNISETAHCFFSNFLHEVRAT